MKILINTPDLKLPGGVANYYSGLKQYWSEDVSYNIIGHRNGIPGPIILIYDYIKFVILCALYNYDVIILNPSLGKNAIRRDSLFLKIANYFGIKTVVFFRGWAEEMVAKIDSEPKQFADIFNKANKILVLAHSFKENLIKWGIKSPIYITTTKVNDELIEDFDFFDKPWNHNILFLTRIETYKGIFITLEAFNIVKDKFPKATLTVAGDGSQLETAKDFVRHHCIKDVNFLGNIQGKLLSETFLKSSIYILPSYSEGMPNSLLEAMSFGNSVISRPIGGIVDFFEEQRMGYLIAGLQPEKYAEKIIHLLEDKEQIKEIGRYNHCFAKKNFLASKVALEIEKILLEND